MINSSRCLRLGLPDQRSPVSNLPSVMIVDDLPANLRLLVRMLRNQQYRVRPFPNGRLALSSAEQDPPDLIVLDISMPEMDGYEVCQVLKSRDRLKDIPVIFLSALDDTADKVRAFRAGGVDYITKPFQLEEIRARINTHLPRRKLEREQKTRNEQLQSSLGRLQELEAFRDGLVHMLVHDMRSPLTSILNNCEFLNHTLDTSPVSESFEVLSDVQSSAQRLAEMINELLDVNRLESGQLPLNRSDISPDQLIQQSLSTVVKHNEPTRIAVQCQTNRPVSCDINLMQRVVCNLLDNAQKFSPPNSPIKLVLREDPAGLRVEVSDVGPGIPIAFRHRIFEKFARLDSTTHRLSVGLGLTFCKLAVEAHSGTIGVDSPSGGTGSRFWFTLPGTDGPSGTLG